MTNPIGVNILLDHIADYGRLVSRLKALKPALIVAMIDSAGENGKELQRIIALRSELPGTLVIGRVHYVQDGGMHTPPKASEGKYVVSPENALNAWGELGRNGGVLYLQNEPATDITDAEMKVFVEWTCEAIELAHKRGIRLCVGNFGTGQPIVKNGQWDVRLDPILKFLSIYREMILGVHEYDPGDNDRTGRIQAMFTRCAAIGIQPPFAALTETGYDKGDNQPSEINGYHSRGISGEAFAQRRFFVWRRWYIKHPEIIGEAVFCAGKTWPPFDVEGDDGFFQTLIANPITLPSPTVPPAEPPAPPAPTIPAEWRNALADMLLNLQMRRARLTGQRRTVDAEKSAFQSLLENRTDWLTQIDKELADLEQFANRLSKLS